MNSTPIFVSGNVDIFNQMWDNCFLPQTPNPNLVANVFTSPDTVNGTHGKFIVVIQRERLRCSVG